MEGSGSCTAGYAMCDALSQSVSPVSVSLSFATAPISPAWSSVTGVIVLPSSVPMCDRRSPPPRAEFTRLASFFITPDMTLKYDTRPANGSATVLNTNRRTRARSRRPCAASRCRSPIAVTVPRSVGAGKVVHHEISDLVAFRYCAAPDAHSTGTMRMSRTRLREVRRRCARPAACPRRRTLPAARRCPRPPSRPAPRAPSCAASAMSAGMSPSLPLPSPSGV